MTGRMLIAGTTTTTTTTSHVRASTTAAPISSHFAHNFASGVRGGKVLSKAGKNGSGLNGKIGVKRVVILRSSLTNAWQDLRTCTKVFRRFVPAVAGDHHGPLVVDDLGGQYEETFDDVEKHLLDYFTYKGVRTVLAQLSEMNPHQYAWFYNFVVNNKPQDSKVFIRLLVKERQELGERVMVTRLHLFNKWVKKYNHAQLHKAISDQNLELLRERLIQTVKFSNSTGDDIETTPP